MPISFKYSWTETEDAVEIKVPYKGKSIEHTDIYLSDVFLKVSYPPQLLVLDLAHKIVVNSSKAIKKNDELFIYLLKSTGSHGLWKSLLFQGSKGETMKRRNASILKRQEEVKKCDERARDTKLEEERMTLRKQMAIDQSELEQIDEVKRREKKDAEDAVYETISRMNSSSAGTPNERPSPIAEEGMIHSSNSNITSVEETGSDVKGEANIKGLTKPPVKKAWKPKKKHSPQSSSPKPCAPVRQLGIVKFKHTARYFKTPSRESTHLQEEIFLAKNRPYLKHNKYFNHVGDNDSSLSSDIGEKDPIWLKRKGDEYFAGEDYLSAINAYTEAIEKDDAFLQVIANRAACYMLIGEFGHCIQDCNMALEVLDRREARGNDDRATVEGSRSLHSLRDDKCRQIRKKIMVRLGSAYCQLEDQNPADCLSRFQKAHVYLGEAASQSPDHNESSLHHDIQCLGNLIQAHACKKDADIALGLGKTDEAILLYNEAIEGEKSILSAHANRAAAHYLNHDYKSCVSDCTHVLEELKNRHPTHEGRPLVTFGGIPPPGSGNRCDLVKVCLCRRAAAYLQMNATSLANHDIQAVSKFFGELCLDLGMDEEPITPCIL